MLTITDNKGKDVPEPKDQYGDVDYIMLGSYAQAKFILVFRLGPDEFNSIYGCTITTQIWDTLMNVHEGTSQVQKFRIAILCTKMSPTRRRMENH